MEAGVIKISFKYFRVQQFFMIVLAVTGLVLTVNREATSFVGNHSMNLEAGLFLMGTKGTGSVIDVKLCARNMLSLRLLKTKKGS